MNTQIVAEVRKVVARYGQRTTAWEFRDIVQTAEHFIDDGMRLEEAADSAVVVVLRLYGIEDPPWSERSPRDSSGPRTEVPGPACATSSRRRGP